MNRKPINYLALPPCFLFTALLATLLATTAIADNGQVHPGCLDAAIQAGENAPATINISACNESFKTIPAYDYLGLLMYERPRGAAGELRGSLAYESVRAGNHILFRLEDNAGGSGVFSSLLLASEIERNGEKLLTDLQAFSLGDRCNLGLAWIGVGADDDLTVAISLTPAALLLVLAAPPSRLPDSTLDTARARQAFTDSSLKSLSSCATCCIGQAIYSYSPQSTDWQLQGIDLLSPDILDHADFDSLRTLLRESGIDIRAEGSENPADSL